MTTFVSNQTYTSTMRLKVRTSWTSAPETQSYDPMQIRRNRYMKLIQDNITCEADDFVNFFIQATDLYLNEETNSEVRQAFKWWFINRGEDIFWNELSDKERKTFSYEVIVTMMSMGDWYRTRKPLIISMPTEYMERYLLEEIPTIGPIQVPPHFKCISKRSDHFGQYPRKWMYKVYYESIEKKHEPSTEN